MKQTAFAGIVLLSLAASAKAPVPDFYWDQDFDVGSKQGVYLSLNGNGLEDGGKSVLIGAPSENGGKGVFVSWADAPKGCVSVLVRYSDFAYPATGYATIGVCDSVYEKIYRGDHAGVGTDAAGTTQAIWGEVLQRDDDTQGTFAEGDGYYLFRYVPDQKGTTLFQKRGGAWQQVYLCAGLRATDEKAGTSENGILGFAVGGGCHGVIGNASPLSGMKVLGIAVFGTELSTDAASEYVFPSERAAINGTWTHDDGTRNWSATGFWQLGTVADWGVATFSACPANLNIDSDGVALKGLIRLGDRAMTLSNPDNGIRFLGQPSFIVNWSSDLTVKGPLTGTGSNRLEFGGRYGTWLESLASDFGEVAVVDGFVGLTAKSGTVLSRGNVVLNDGEIRIAPALAYGETVSVSMCDEGRFTCGPGLGRIVLDRSSCYGVTLTLPSLVCDNGALCVCSTESPDAIGNSEKVLVSDPPAVENGMITPAVAIYDATGSKADYFRGSYFATYDSERGIVPADAPEWWTDDDQGNSIVWLSSSYTVSAAKSVYALYWDAIADNTLTLNADLKIVSGGLILNLHGDENAPRMAIGGTGALDFGDRQGIIRGAGISSSENYTVSIALNAPVKGTKGVVFSGSPLVPSGNVSGIYEYTLTTPAAWTGPTVVANGAKLVIASDIAANALPAGGDVYVIGGDHRNGASIRLMTPVTFEQNFVMAGAGAYGRGNGNTGPFHLGGGDFTVTFNGATRFQDIVYFAHDGGGNTMKFVGKVTGGGRVQMQQGVLEFAGENDYSGMMIVTGGNAAIVVSGDGSLGSAEVFASTGALRLENLNGQTLANDITCSGSGTLTIDGGHVVLTGRVTASKTVVKNGAIVEIGDNVDLGQVTFEGGAKILAASGAKRPRVEIGGDGTSDVLLSGGLSAESDVTLVKNGANTVVINRGCAFGGALAIAEGAVKLLPGLLANASTLWLDASQADTVTAADGFATAWRSANGNGRVFYPNGGDEHAVYPSVPMNGLDTVGFDPDASTYQRLVCNGSVDMRSVFVCLRPRFRTDRTNSTPWGYWGSGSEFGLRWMDNTWQGLGFEQKRINGGKTDDTVKSDGVPMVVGQFNADGSAKAKALVPSLGCYQDWSYESKRDLAFNGDIAELIAFGYELPEDEKKAVEQYLAKKWGVYGAEGIWPEADVSAVCGGPVLAETAALTMAAGTVLDLNGADQTIASLTGIGLVTNTAARAATLTVTGTCDFNGVIAANVTLVASGAVRGEVNGTLVADGAEVALTDTAYAPPAEGRLWWFDASAVSKVTYWDDTPLAGSLQTNEYGRVERWYAQGDATTLFECAGNSTYEPQNRGLYVPPAEGVAPGIYINTYVRMQCNKGNTPHTIAVMYEFDERFDSLNYFFCGMGFGDATMRADQSGIIDGAYNFKDGSSFSNVGDHIYVNGTRIDIDGSNVALPMGGLCCYIGTRDPSHTDKNWTNRKFCFGSDAPGHGLFGTKLCEAICYDRMLSDDECRALNAYLTEKWHGRGARKAKVGPGAVLGAKGGGTLDVSAASPAAVAKLVSDAEGGKVVGDLTVGAFEYDAQNAAAAVPLTVQGKLTIAQDAPFTAKNTGNLAYHGWKLLKADAATGSFAPGDLGAPCWRFWNGGTTWGLASGGLMFFVK